MPAPPDSPVARVTIRRRCAMNGKRTLILSCFAAAILTLGFAGVAPANSAPPEKRADGVDCAWRCDCARQLDDCDAEESQWDACIDVKPTKHPNKVATCEACKEIAERACRARTCPPDPNKGPKYLFEYTCDGKPQPVSVAPRQLEEALAVSPSVGSSSLEDLQRQEPKEVAQAQRKGDVQCNFGCSCGVTTGMCDDHEARHRFCFDKADRTKTASSCGLCEIKATFACLNEKCPILPGSTKVLTHFQCPAS